LPHVSPSKTKFNGVEPGDTSTAPVNVTPRSVMFRTPDPKLPPDIVGDAPASAATVTIPDFAPPLHDPYDPDARNTVSPACACENIDANDDGVAWKSAAPATPGAITRATSTASAAQRCRGTRQVAGESGELSIKRLFCPLPEHADADPF
jgi:hypothetical protein